MTKRKQVVEADLQRQLERDRKVRAYFNILMDPDATREEIVDHCNQLKKIKMDKKSKSEVDYSKGMPKSHCGICEYFLSATKACTKVQGVITPSMWCRLFEKARS